MALALLTTGRYELDGHPEVFRPPGFPAFLLPAVATGIPIAATAALNALIGGVTVGLAYATAYRIVGARAAWWAGLFCGLEPGQVLLSGFFLADTLLAGFAMAIGWAGVAYLSSRRRVWVPVIGLLAAGAAYVKTVAYFLPIWLAACVWLFATGERRHRLNDAVLLMVVAGALIGVWHVRNYAVAGYPGFSTQIARAALYREVAGVRARREGISLEVARTREAEALGTDPRAHQTDAHYAGNMWRRYFRFVIENPRGFAGLHARGAYRVLTTPWRPRLLPSLFGLQPPRDRDVTRTLSTGGSIAGQPVAARRAPVWVLASVVLPLVNWLYLGLSVLALRPERRPRPRWWLVALAAYFVILASGTAASAEPSRLRLPIMPILSVMAGLAVDRLLAGRRQAPLRSPIPDPPTPGFSPPLAPCSSPPPSLGTARDPRAR